MWRRAARAPLRPEPTSPMHPTSPPCRPAPISAPRLRTRWRTRNAEIIAVAPDWRTKALSAISDPNIAFLLMLIGFYGLILEFWNPGSFAPGVIGAISLIVGLTALTALPVNYGALGLLV